MGLSWAAFGDGPLWLGIFLASWGCLLCSIARTGQEEQRKGRLLAVYCPEPFVLEGFPWVWPSGRKSDPAQGIKLQSPPWGHSPPYHAICCILPWNEEADQPGPQTWLSMERGGTQPGASCIAGSCARKKRMPRVAKSSRPNLQKESKEIWIFTNEISQFLHVGLVRNK